MSEGSVGPRSSSEVVVDEPLLAAGDPGTPTSVTMTVDDVYDHIGEFGRRQILLFVVVALTWFPAGIVVLDMAFFGKNPIKEHLWRCTDASDVACASVFKEVDPAHQFCRLQPSQWEWTHPNESVRSDLGLFCDKAWLLDFTNSIFFLGFLAGSALAGISADKYGRRFTLCSTIVLAALATASVAATFSILPFMTARFLQGLTVGGTYVVAFTLNSELVGASWRGVLGILCQGFWTIGACLLPLLALAVPNWRWQTVVCASTMLAMVLVFPFIPESPRWLLSQMKVRESTAVLQAIAHGNGTTMPGSTLALPRDTTGPTLTLLDTFRVPELRSRMLILMFCWFVASLAYYGLSLALDDLPGSLYFNFFLIAFVEFPSYACTILLINRLGRRLLSVAMFACAGASCMLVAAIPNGDPGSITGSLRIITAVIGKFGVAAAFAILFVYTAELFPTVVRSAALGANSASARAGGITSPMVVLLGDSLNAGWLSFVVFGVTSIFAGCTMLWLPETQGQPLPETLEDLTNGCNDDRTHSGHESLLTNNVIDDHEAKLIDGEEA